MSHGQDRSQKRKAKLEARRKQAMAKAPKASTRQHGSPGGAGEVYMVSSQGPMSAPPGSETWPIVRAYAPVPDVWTATGLGTAGIVRQGPDGRLVEVLFRLSAREGIDAAIGKPDRASLDELAFESPKLRALLPPWERSTPERAAELIWGAIALTRHQDADLPGIEGYLHVVPRVPGTERTWLERFVGPGGLTPEELVKLVMSMPSEAFTETKEPMVLTTVSFHADDPAALAEILAGREPEFHLASPDEGASCFDWTRDYPPGHWSPLAQLGGRQVLGSVTVGKDEVIAEAKSLSMTARLLGILKEHAGASLRLRAVKWENPASRETWEIRC